MQTQDEQLTVDQPVENQEEPKEESKKPEKKKKTVMQEILSWILTLGMAVVIALVIRTFLFEPVRVDGQSMMDTLHDGDIMLVTKPEYLIGDPKHGDVVICHYPGRGNTNFVKRILGVPGDTIEIRDNVVYRNGEAVAEPYLTPERNDDGFDMDPLLLGDEEYFVCGDNRDNSHDSRNFYYSGQPSAIGRDMIKGRVRWYLRGVE